MASAKVLKRDDFFQFPKGNRLYKVLWNNGIVLKYRDLNNNIYTCNIKTKILKKKGSYNF